MNRPSSSPSDLTTPTLHTDALAPEPVIPTRMEAPLLSERLSMPAAIPPTVSSVYINHLIDVAGLKGADLTDTQRQLGLDE